MNRVIDASPSNIEYVIEGTPDVKSDFESAGFLLDGGIVIEPATSERRRRKYPLYFIWDPKNEDGPVGCVMIFREQRNLRWFYGRDSKKLKEFAQRYGPYEEVE